MIKDAEVIKIGNSKQVLGELHKLLVTVPVYMSFPKWLYCQSDLWIHHEIPSKIIEHYSVLGAIVLQMYQEAMNQQLTTYLDEN